MTPEEKLLQKIQGLFFFAGAIAGVFQDIFFFNLGNFQTVVIYGCTTLIILFGFFILSGKFLRVVSSRTLIRAGLAVFVVLNTLFFLLRERSINYIIPLGIISGIGHGLFWPGINLSGYILTKSETRSHYFGKLNFLLYIGLAVGPILGGIIITLFKYMGFPIFGYMALFFLVGIIDFYLFLLAFRLPRHAGIDFSVNDIVSHKRSRSWKIVLSQQFLYGLWDVSFAAFSGVLIYLIVKQELAVGVVKTGATVLFAVASVWAGKLLSEKSNLVLPASILSAIGLLVFGIAQNWLGILFFMILTNLFQPFLNIATSKLYYDVIDESDETWQNKYHYLIERDSVLGLGRILNYIVLLILFTPENQVHVAKSWILVIPIFPVIIGLLAWQMQKEKVTKTKL